MYMYVYIYNLIYMHMHTNLVHTYSCTLLVQLYAYMYNLHVLVVQPISECSDQLQSTVAIPKSPSPYSFVNNIFFLSLIKSKA